MNAENASLRDFPGRDHLIAAIDEAVSRGECTAIVRQLRHKLCLLMREGTVRLPTCVRQAVPGHYARRELYRSQEHGYAVIAMTWGSGQGTPIHDHHGMWCVEGVWAGQLEITQYDLTERDGSDFRFIEVGTLIAGTGSAGSLIPPHEYHAIKNASDREMAVSLHIYAEPMTRCGVFAESPRGEGWYRHMEKQLSLDAAA
ncbi:cysteine dioxygenase [Lysobacter pythonis]|uniref:Cysteine dioxygenase n=1 Tax=Solilutibacter pythonis TaxID=2483112 RepID=A0A3M2I7M2_9GAMM|nr:cysteine dioxygenase family protein [Lysobacter pythonis]RMH94487.1 cysteine dioxygenase [Lysobacter pythonis]